MSDPQSHVRRFVREHIEAVFIAIFIAILLRSFVISAYKIPSESMAPSLLAGDFVLGYKLPFGVKIPILGTKVGTASIPRRGELVIFHIKDENMDSQTYIKRVVGVPGDRIEMQDGILVVNQKIVTKETASGDEAREYRETLAGRRYHVILGQNKVKLTISPTVVPPSHVYVLADNRGLGDDSRHFGPVPIKQIEARAVVIWLSLIWESKSFWPKLRTERIFQTVH